jgi:uncharacterized OB-fold protein
MMGPDFPLPDTEWEGSRGFWEAAARGQLAIPRCADCARWVWYPRPRCPDCDADRLAWTPTSGRGTLFSWAVVRRALLPAFAEQVPYVPGLVALEEDPRVRVVTQLVDCTPDELRAEMPVHAVFRPLVFPNATRRVIAPMFAPSP